MVRIAVLVSGGGTNLQALIDAQSRGELKNGRIAAVLSSRPDAYALERAARAGIPGYVVARKDFASNRVLQRRVMEQAEWHILPQAVSLFCEGRLRVEGRIVHIL